jgi:hypothetical protein
MRGIERKKKNNSLVKRVTVLAALVSVFLTALNMALADPTNPAGLDEVYTSRRGTSPAGEMLAQGGNLTEVNIDATTITDIWQGYYGQVTGTITLDNGDNDTFYDWSVATPSGEIFMSTASSPTWSTIRCANETDLNSTEEAYNISTTAVDGINETFNYTTHDAFSVGGTSFAANWCNHTTNAYASGAAQSTYWDEIALSDQLDVIYAVIINADQTGYNGSNYDFQGLVPVYRNQTTTTYYFFVELS